MKGWRNDAKPNLRLAGSFFVKPPQPRQGSAVGVALFFPLALTLLILAPVLILNPGDGWSALGGLMIGGFLLLPLGIVFLVLGFLSWIRFAKARAYRKGFEAASQPSSAPRESHGEDDGS